MKKYLLLISALLISCCAFAQNKIVIGDMNGDGELTEEDIQILSDNILHNRISALSTDGNVYVQDFVDLGLPSGTLWATCNVGAIAPEAAGHHYAWAEIATKEDFSWNSYAYAEDSYSSLTKYCLTEDCGYEGFTDNLAALLAEDDAVSVNWGSEWQIPSVAQVEELINSKYTTTTWTTQNGVNGLLVTSKVEGHTDKSIFIPAGGFAKNNYVLDSENTGYFWTRTLSQKSSNAAMAWEFSDETNYIANMTRYYGYSLRPVRTGAKIFVTSILLSDNNLGMIPGTSSSLSATVSPADATDKGLIWTSSDESVATVSADGLITAVAPGTATISATAADGMGATASCSVEVMAINQDIVQKYPKTIELIIGQSYAMSETLTADNEQQNFSWTIADTTLATIAPNGTVTAKAEGETAIYAVSDASIIAYTLSIHPTLIISGVTDKTKELCTLQLTVNTTAPLVWTSSDEKIAKVSAKGLVTPAGIGNITITAYDANAVGVSASCGVETWTLNKCDGHEYVDLGLPSGTLWATTNLGANKPEEIGTYEFFSSEGTLSTRKWGKSWSDPSYKQFEELINKKYTKSSWITVNGMEGRLFESIVPGYEGNSIFLPLAGPYKQEANGYGYYGTDYYTPWPGTWEIFVLAISENSVEIDERDAETKYVFRPVRKEKVIYLVKTAEQ